MIDQIVAWFRQLAPASWSYNDIIGQRGEWTPITNPRLVTASANVSPVNGLIRIDATAGNITLTMETAIGADGRIHHLKRIDGSGNTITVQGSGSETIDGGTLSLSTQYKSYTVASNGSGWDVIGEV